MKPQDLCAGYHCVPRATKEGKKHPVICLVKSVKKKKGGMTRLQDFITKEEFDVLTEIVLGNFKRISKADRDSLMDHWKTYKDMDLLRERAREVPEITRRTRTKFPEEEKSVKESKKPNKPIQLELVVPQDDIEDPPETGDPMMGYHGKSNLVLARALHAAVEDSKATIEVRKETNKAIDRLAAAFEQHNKIIEKNG